MIEYQSSSKSRQSYSSDKLYNHGIIEFDRDAPLMPPMAIEMDHRLECIFKSAVFEKRNPDRWKNQVLMAKKACLEVYQESFPEYSMDLFDQYDRSSCLFFARDSHEDINAMIRVCMNLNGLLPLEPFSRMETESWISEGLKVAVVGRHFCKGKGFKKNIQAIYQLGMQFGIDIYLIEARTEHSDYYKKWFGATDIDSYQASSGCVNLRWDLVNTPEVFFKVFGQDQGHLQRFFNQYLEGEK